MAGIIEGNVYRVSLDSERNNIYVSANDTNDLIRFLVNEFVGKRNIYGAKQVNKDGTIVTVQVVTNPLFHSLSAAKLGSEYADANSKENLPIKKSSLVEQINSAESKQQGKNSLPSEKSFER